MGTELVPGEEIATYRVLRKLGSGGMGSVYAAIHTQIERPVAIKVLHSELSQDPQMAARFLDEARAVNMIRHPNIVSVENLGQLPDGSAYMVMEYLDGQTLTSRLKWGGGRLGPVTLHFSRQIASALAAAHDKGIVHCDLKPANVMVIADPEMPGGERVKVLDFGIARLLNGPSQRAERHEAEIIGTPLYMSPEQCVGAATVDGKADVYSLGILLYQLVAGRPPFTGASLREIMDQHLSTPAPALVHVAASVPPHLSALVEGMLAKAPRSRPTMREVAEELERIYALPMTPIAVDRRLRWRRILVYGGFVLIAGLALAAGSIPINADLPTLPPGAGTIVLIAAGLILGSWWRRRREKRLVAWGK